MLHCNVEVTLEGRMAATIIHKANKEQDKTKSTEHDIIISNQDVIKEAR